jgi:hypothetical protein
MWSAASESTLYVFVCVHGHLLHCNELFSRVCLFVCYGKCERIYVSTYVTYTVASVYGVDTRASERAPGNGVNLLARCRKPFIFHLDGT